MKKFFLMLAVALPMFFMASCGDDNDEVDVPYSMPVLTKSASNVLTISNMSINLEWGDDMGDVKEAMRPFSYVLNDQVSNSSALAYTFDADGNYPFYIYAFVGGNLASSSIVITEEMDSEVDFTKYFKDNKYKEVSTDEDDDLIYESKDKMTLVHYGYDGTVYVIWTPNTRADYRQALYTHLEMAKNLVEQRNK